MQAGVDLRILRRASRSVTCRLLALTVHEGECGERNRKTEIGRKRVR